MYGKVLGQILQEAIMKGNLVSWSKSFGNDFRKERVLPAMLLLNFYSTMQHNERKSISDK